MGVDLKVHVGHHLGLFFNVFYKGRQCYNMRPRESFFSEFAKVD
jgi:hypothetical protein